MPDEPARLAGVLGEFVQLELRYRATVVVLGQEAAEPACFVRCPLERPAEARLEVEKSSGLPLDAGYEPLGVP